MPFLPILLCRLRSFAGRWSTAKFISHILLLAIANEFVIPHHIPPEVSLEVRRAELTSGHLYSEKESNLNE